MKKMIVLLLQLICFASFSQTTWHTVPTETNKKLLCIDFPSSNVGYIGGEDSLLLKTTDGGTTWDSLSYTGVTIFSGGGDVLKLQFINELVGYMVFGEYGGLYKTTDGALSWTNVTISGDMCFTHGLYMFSEDEGVVGGHACFGYERIDRISAGTGTAATLPPFTLPWSSMIVDFDFYDTNLGIGVSKMYGFFRTTDGGLNWDTISRPSILPITAELTSVEFINDTLVYAGYSSLGSGSGILWSHNAGLTWSMEIASATFAYPTYNAVQSAQNGDIYTGGESGFSSGIILEKSGINWTSTNTPQIINGIESYGSDITWCVGDSGYVVVNQNPGLLTIEQYRPAFEFEIYPNPVHDVLKIKLSAFADINSVTIYDMTGKIYYFSNDFESDIDVSMLPRGVFLISVNDNNTSISKRFVKTTE